LRTSSTNEKLLADAFVTEEEKENRNYRDVHPEGKVSILEFRGIGALGKNIR